MNAVYIYSCSKEKNNLKSNYNSMGKEMKDSNKSIYSH